MTSTLTPLPPSSTGLVDREGLQDALEGLLGLRPSRDLLRVWRAKGMPTIVLGARTILFDVQDVLRWIRAQSVSRPAPQVARNAGQRIVADPRLRLQKPLP